MKKNILNWLMPRIKLIITSKQKFGSVFLFASKSKAPIRFLEFHCFYTFFLLIISSENTSTDHKSRIEKVFFTAFLCPTFFSVNFVSAIYQYVFQKVFTITFFSTLPLVSDVHTVDSMWDVYYPVFSSKF